MLKEKVRDIEILYLEEDSDVIDAIKLVVERNYSAFLTSLKKKRTITLFESDDPNHYEMYDFQNEFNKIMKKFLECEDIKDILENASLLDWYLMVFKKEDDSILIDVDIDYDLDARELKEIFNLLVRYRYYKENGTIDDFLENQLSSRDANKLFTWLQNETRFPFYNELIKSLLNTLQEDDYLYHNLGPLYLMLTEEQDKTVDERACFSLCNDFASIKENDLYLLMDEFLNYINAPYKWKELFHEIRLNDRIKIYKEDELEEGDTKKTTFMFLDDVPTIQLVSTGKIDDFTALVHEFIHYLNPIDSTEISSFIIRELPSIYFEIIAGQFLVQKGYSDSIIKYVYAIHYLDNYLSSYYNSILMYRLIDYLRYGDNSLIREFNDVLEQKDRSICLGTQKLLTEDLEQLFHNINDNIDEINKKILNDGIYTLSGIQYVIAMRIIDRIDLEKVKDLMMDIAYNIDKYDLESILELFNVSLFEDISKKYLKK